MTSAEIRQSFLDFFCEKQHTIVASSSLLPEAPNLLFTNAGMNQFVPIFLGQQKPAWNPPRVADTQKCIRAGGKHNDLEDVGLDTYHHTFFEMLGNWSFGDYFKKEAIEWAWELLVDRWKFPAQRLYATVYQPGPGEPSEFDQEAHDHWARLFREADLDPAVHIVSGGKADNFWMMGDTGPCGPCSEVHVDLTRDGDTRGTLVNKNDPHCIEIWNLVFIQFNANPDGTFTPLPQRHVDTGMGFERVTAIIQGTKNLTDFSGTVSNYETDIFRPIFDEIEKLSGERYGSTLPPRRDSDRQSQIIQVVQSIPPGKVMTFGEIGYLCSPPVTGWSVGQWIRRCHAQIPWWRVVAKTGHPPLARKNPQLAIEQARKLAGEGIVLSDHGPINLREFKLSFSQFQIDIAFRAIADHIRAFSFAIADGIIPSNEGRGYVLRRILRRAVRYGRTLRFHEPFFFKLVDVVAQTMGDVFPEVRAKQKIIMETIRREEESFNKTLDKGIELFNRVAVPHAISNALEKEGLQETSTTWGPSATNVADWAYLSDAERAQKNVDSHEGFEIRNRRTNEVVYSGKRRYFLRSRWRQVLRSRPVIPATAAFKLYDTYGFPLDLTELMARERGLTVDVAGFEKLMDEQRERARKARKKQVVTITQLDSTLMTEFVGYDLLETTGRLIHLKNIMPQPVVSTDRSPFYATMGGQVADKGTIRVDNSDYEVVDVQKQNQMQLLILKQPVDLDIEHALGSQVDLRVNASRRHSIERHHTVTHLLHWALHELVSRDASQKGSYVGPDKLTFDFSSAPLTKQQVHGVEKLVNEKIAENAPVSWIEIPYSEVKERKDIIQFFGEKYSDTVRVLQIGGEPKALNGYSMELCGGTHVRSTSEIGVFRIVREEAIAAGIRRIEAVAGDAVRAWAKEEAARQQEKFEMFSRKKPNLAGLPVFAVEAATDEMLKQIDARAVHLEKIDADVHDWEKKQAKASEAQLQSRAATIANELAASHAGKDSCVFEVPNADSKLLGAVVDALKTKFNGPIVLAGATDGSVALIATVPKELTSKVQADKLIQQIASIVGGKGGGRPESARGAGKDVSKIKQALDEAREIIGGHESRT